MEHLLGLSKPSTLQGLYPWLLAPLMSILQKNWTVKPTEKPGQRLGSVFELLSLSYCKTGLWRSSHQAIPDTFLLAQCCSSGHITFPDKDAPRIVCMPIYYLLFWILSWWWTSGSYRSWFRDHWLKTKNLGLFVGTWDSVVLADHTEVLLFCTLATFEISRVVAPTGGIFDFHFGGAMKTCGLSLDHGDSEGWWYHWNQNVENSGMFLSLWSEVSQYYNSLVPWKLAGDKSRLLVSPQLGMKVIRVQLCFKCSIPVGEHRVPPRTWMVACFCIVCRSWCSFLVMRDSRQEEGAWEGKVKWIE